MRVSLPCMKKLPEYTFDDYLSCFPAVDLPVNLTEASIYSFEKENKPFPQGIIEQFILPIESEVPDEFTEFFPCFQLRDTHQFTAVVYWKAKLMQYEFILATYDEKNQLIKSAVIAGTKTNQEQILQSVAHIDEEWRIHIVEGVQDVGAKAYDPKNSNHYSMEILDTGEIIFSLNDELV